jgi:hypothetical protein
MQLFSWTLPQLLAIPRGSLSYRRLTERCSRDQISLVLGGTHALRITLRFPSLMDRSLVISLQPNRCQVGPLLRQKQARGRNSF